MSIPHPAGHSYAFREEPTAHYVCRKCDQPWDAATALHRSCPVAMQGPPRREALFTGSGLALWVYTWPDRRTTHEVRDASPCTRSTWLPPNATRLHRGAHRQRAPRDRPRQPYIVDRCLLGADTKGSDYACSCIEGDPATGECLPCGERDCPGGEPLHYHHDGCPHCDMQTCDDPGCERWAVISIGSRWVCERHEPGKGAP